VPARWPLLTRRQGAFEANSLIFPDAPVGNYRESSLVLGPGQKQIALKAAPRKSRASMLGARQRAFSLGIGYQKIGKNGRAKVEFDRFRKLKDQEAYRTGVLESLATAGR
jgi:hypothetical protein